MLHPSSSENLRLGVDPWIARLPTPGLERNAFISSPSVSRVSSSTSIASLSDRNFAQLKPLPSPGPDHGANASSNTSTPVTEDSSPTSTSGSKTHAFFSSPFSIAVVRSPPSQPQSRSVSLSVHTTKPLREPLDASPSIFTEEPNSAADTPMATEPEVVTPSAPSRSQTASASFFFGAPKGEIATAVPPPNLEPIAKKKPTTIPGFSTLSRFFPSRTKANDTEDNFQVTEPTPPASSDSGPPTLGQPTPQRTFVELDEKAIPKPPMSPPKTPQSVKLQVPSPVRARRQASPERLLAHFHASTHPQPTSPRPEAAHAPIRRETDRHQDYVGHDPVPGQVVGQPDTPLRLIKQLGQGAFSAVWLASDETAELALSRSASIGRGLSRQGSAGKRVTRRRRRSQSYAKKERDGKMEGLKPPPFNNHPQEADETRTSLDSVDGRPSTSESSQPDKDTSKSPRLLASRSFASLRLGDKNGSRLVAVKMMDRAMCDANDRTRISFVREVEVLRHISHPSIVAYLHSFTTPTHHCLVLEHIAGGELFDLLNNDERHTRLTEPLLRRMFTELCRAVAWMHSVSLVHRDIKLENILLTCNPFDPAYIAPGSTTPSLDLLPAPLLKLTDFGLSRFIDPENPLLVTRCGSESYAAPEIVMAAKYDGRQTDAWALGVVLFALATRVLPFDRAPSHTRVGSGSEQGSLPSPSGSVASSVGGQGRRSYLIRIAKSEYSWPTDENSRRLATEGLRKVVGRLLVRDARKRATVLQLWDEEWMNGDGAMSRPGEGYRITLPTEPEPINGTMEDTPVDPEGPFDGVEALETEGEADEVEAEAEPDPDSGLLMDGESISHVAKQDIN